MSLLLPYFCEKHKLWPTNLTQYVRFILIITVNISWKFIISQAFPTHYASRSLQQEKAINSTYLLYSVGRLAFRG